MMNEIAFTQLITVLQKEMGRVRDAIKEIDYTAASTQASTDDTYVVISASATLTAERILTAGTNISITDGGAGGNVTVATTGVTDDVYAFFLS